MEGGGCTIASGASRCQLSDAVIGVHLFAHRCKQVCSRLRLERLHAETLAKGHFGIFSCCGAPWDAKTLGTISLEPLQQQCNVINATRHGERQSRPCVGPG